MAVLDGGVLLAFGAWLMRGLNRPAVLRPSVRLPTRMNGNGTPWQTTAHLGGSTEL